MRFITLLLLLLSLNICAQQTITTHFCDEAPKLDGYLSERCWDNLDNAYTFYQFDPVNGEPSRFQTSVSVLYTDYAIYVGVRNHDCASDSIMMQLSQRDNFGQADYFGIMLDPFNDGLNGYAFYVTSAGVQVDALMSPNRDWSWNAVWNSAAAVDNRGWTVEMEIPYSAIRFPEQNIQQWGINFVRNVQRNREVAYWNNVDKNIDGLLKQMGDLSGIENIEPPIRLSATPYITGYFAHSGENGTSYSVKGGLDMKYGLSDSYTLDMMLIPDFGQVESDAKVLNLGPFEQFYGENRTFFKEGTEIFNKGDIFYSRRIGASPKDFSTYNEHEVTEKAPATTQLINATKISGKGKNGLSFGGLNAMSTNTYNIVKDTVTGNEREVLTQPFTNYNLMVFDQALKNNSYVSFTNSNMYVTMVDYLANVSAGQFKLESENSMFAFSGNGAVSHINNGNGESSTGLKGWLKYAKTGGRLRWSVSATSLSPTFDINDMGYMYRNNYTNMNSNLSYNVFRPGNLFLNQKYSMSYNHSRLSKPFVNTDNSFWMSASGTTVNYMYISLSQGFSLGERYDYYEPRVDGRYYQKPAFWQTSARISPDYRKMLAFDANGGVTMFDREKMYEWWIGLEPLFRVNDKFNFRLVVKNKVQANNVGFADNVGDTAVYFGQRNLQTLENAIRANYVFNNTSALSFKFRHYWRTVDYNAFFTLEENGGLKAHDNVMSSNINANNLTVDMAYTWYFAPGSEISIVWKSALDEQGDVIEKDYFDNVRTLMDIPGQNTISVRVLYHLDYFKVKEKLL
jgi:hypothetical protein